MDIESETSRAPDTAVAPAAFAPRWAVVGIFMLLLVAGLGYARAFLMPTVLAFLLALVFSPVRRTLERLGLSSGLASFVITGVLFVATVGSVLVLAAPVSEWILEAQTISSQIEWKLRDLRDVAAQVQEAADQIDSIGTAEGEEVERVVVEGPGLASSVAFSVPGALAQGLFTFLLLQFLLASGDMFYEKTLSVLPTFGEKRRAVMIARDIERKLSKYLFTITAINAGLGVAVGLGMWALEMPSPLLFGISAFLLNYIPYLGAVAGVALAGAVALVSLPTMWDAGAVAAVYLALTSIEGQFVTPVLVGRSLRLNTVIVFLSVTFWAWLWSVVGMLVAMPLLVSVRVFCEHIPSLEGVGRFLSARGDEREENGADQADQAD